MPSAKSLHKNHKCPACGKPIERTFALCPYCATSLDQSTGATSGRLIQFETETAWFGLANALDIVLTFLLIRRGEFFESNPIARYFINHWGLKGMIGFKLALVLIVVAITQYVARTKPQLARAILIFGTVVVTAVVIYSVSLHRAFVG